MSAPRTPVRPGPGAGHLVVHFTPPPPSSLSPDSTAVVIDVLRATTTIVHALAAGCPTLYPCLEVEEAVRLAESLRGENPLLAGERQGRPLAGFDVGNSPEDFTPALCRRRPVVLTTTNGTRALLHAASAARVLVAAFVNCGAVCEPLGKLRCPVHVICAGQEGQVALEDVLLAGMLCDRLAQSSGLHLADSARAARAAYLHHRADLEGVLRSSAGGALLHELGYDDDIRAAAQVDRFACVPVLRRGPLRLELFHEGYGQAAEEEGEVS